MVFITDISIDSFMLKNGYIIFVLLIIISCNNFTTKKEEELIIGNRTLYILSESTSISGSGSFKIVLSNDKKIDIKDLDLTSNYIIFYKIFNNRLVLYSNKKLIVPKGLKKDVVIEYPNKEDYLNNFIMKKSNNKKLKNNIQFYQPFK